MFLKPVTTEKAIAGIELRNALTFKVTKEVTKQQVKQEIEKDYNAKVSKVTSSITPKGEKKVTVIFKDKGKAADIAAKLKLV